MMFGSLDILKPVNLPAGQSFIYENTNASMLMLCVVCCLSEFDSLYNALGNYNTFDVCKQY